LSSNLRPTTRECVRLVTRGHFRSRDKDGGHNIQSAVAEKPMLHANFTALYFLEAALLPVEVSHTGYGFLRFLLPWPWPWLDDLHIHAWPVCQTKNM